MSEAESRQRVFITLGAAKEGAQGKERVYEVADIAGGREPVYVVAPSPLAARAIWFESIQARCEPAEKRERSKPSPVKRATAAVAKLSEEERAALLAALMAS